jgi:hypothetical protein
MPDLPIPPLGGYPQTPRQVADHIVCAVLDANHEYRDRDAGERAVRVSDAVLEALRDCGVHLVEDRTGRVVAY